MPDTRHCHRWTRAEINAFALLWKTGKPLTEIAVRLGRTWRSCQVARGKFEREGDQRFRPRHDRKWSRGGKMIEVLAAAWQAGLSYREIAKLMGTTVAAISNRRLELFYAGDARFAPRTNRGRPRKFPPVVYPRKRHPAPAPKPQEGCP